MWMNLAKVAFLTALMVLAFRASQNGHYRLVEFRGDSMPKPTAILDSRTGTVYTYASQTRQWTVLSPFEGVLN